MNKMCDSDFAFYFKKDAPSVSSSATVSTPFFVLDLSSYPQKFAYILFKLARSTSTNSCQVLDLVPDSTGKCKIPSLSFPSSIVEDGEIWVYLTNSKTCTTDPGAPSDAPSDAWQYLIMFDMIHSYVSIINDSFGFLSTTSICGPCQTTTPFVRFKGLSVLTTQTPAFSLKMLKQSWSYIVFVTSDGSSCRVQKLVPDATGTCQVQSQSFPLLDPTNEPISVVLSQSPSCDLDPSAPGDQWRYLADLHTGKMYVDISVVSGVQFLPPYSSERLLPFDYFKGLLSQPSSI